MPVCLAMKASRPCLGSASWLKPIDFSLPASGTTRVMTPWGDRLSTATPGYSASISLATPSKSGISPLAWRTMAASAYEADRARSMLAWIARAWSLVRLAMRSRSWCSRC